jgi:hypothetical protein
VLFRRPVKYRPAEYHPAPPYLMKTLEGATRVTCGTSVVTLICSKDGFDGRWERWCIPSTLAAQVISGTTPGKSIGARTILRS